MVAPLAWGACTPAAQARRGDAGPVSVSTTALPVARTGVVARLRRFAASIAAGAVAGLAVGGVGGRLAMLLLRVTSDPSLHGLDTDDGFTIGVVSGETMFLLLATTMVGAIGGAVYFFARPVLPGASAAWSWGALGALVGGADLLRPGGIDFTLIEPQALAVALFVAIPALGAAATSVLAERWLARGPRGFAWFLAFGPFLLFGLSGPSGLAALVVVVALAIAMPPTWVAWRGAVPAAVVVAGRVVLAAVGAYAAVELVRDVLDIL